MPSLGGATGWLNSAPLDPAQLRVVLVDFWTLTCINWLRTAPYLRAWWEAYQHDGGVEEEADWGHLGTPQTYLGYERSEHFATPGGAAFDEPSGYELLERLRLNHWALAGEWTIGAENVVLDRAGGSIACRFHARDAHLVLSAGARAPIPFRVLLDGEAPHASGGMDVDEDGNGLLRDGRLYQLVRAHDAIRDRTLESTFLEPGAEGYGFTFG
jgi:hypothetical protein